MGVEHVVAGVCDLGQLGVYSRRVPRSVQATLCMLVVHNRILARHMGVQVTEAQLANNRQRHLAFAVLP
eukprot:4210752-Lingulodinium_polyedra.AAC.1